MDAPELKPCPFCAGRDICWTSAKGVTVNKCMNCHAQGPVARWDLHQGSSAAETMHMRRNEAQRLWQMRADIPAARIEELEAENARLRELIFGAGVNLWDRAELSERDENGNRTILLWHPTGVPSLVLRVEKHALGMDAGHIEFAMSDLLDVFMTRERARAALDKGEG